VSQSGLFGLYTPVAAPIDIEKYIPMNPEQHPGDKTSSWSFLKVDLDTFMLMNNAIRAEVTKFEALLFRLGDRQLHTWEKEAIKEWWGGHYQHILHHHKIEDEVFFPLIRTRVAVMSEFETTHEELEGLLHIVDKSIRNRQFQTAAELAPCWHGYRTALYPQLVEEEKIMIPLKRAYFTPADMQQKLYEVVRAMPKLALGSLLHHIPGGKEGVMTFLARSGFSWHAWYTEVHATRTAYREQMESKLESLLRGQALVLRHKADFVETHLLKPLRLNERLVTHRSNAADLTSQISAELSTGRLSVSDALRDVNLPLGPQASRHQYVEA